MIDMPTLTKKLIHWRIGTIDETLLVIHKIDKRERPFCYFPDGHQQAIRIQINRDTGEVINDFDGNPQIVAPWLLSDVFSLPNKK